MQLLLIKKLNIWMNLVSLDPLILIIKPGQIVISRKLILYRIKLSRRFPLSNNIVVVTREYTRLRRSPIEHLLNILIIHILPTFSLDDSLFWSKVPKCRALKAIHDGVWKQHIRSAVEHGVFGPEKVINVLNEPVSREVDGGHYE